MIFLSGHFIALNCDSSLATTPQPVDQLDGESASTQETATIEGEEDWTQWRGPRRSGVVSVSTATTWPNSLSQAGLKKMWSVPLSPSYSGPIVVENLVFTTETKDKKYEVVSAINRTTGQTVWSTRWEGSMTVPFFAKANGDWIRSTPIYEAGKLYVGGMKDVLVCVDAASGEQLWRVDFPQQLKTENPAFGFVCSPMIDGEFLYVQAGEGFCKIKKESGEIIWKSLADGGGMNGSAFASPVIATICGVKQALVQTRLKLCGVDLESGKELWSRDIATFRGMNIMTPVVHGDHLFVSSYGGNTQYIKVARSDDETWTTHPVWTLPAQGYMNSPVIIDGHVYMHLRNQRLACYDLSTGKETWRSKPMGKYASMIASGDKILALDERGDLMLLRANPKEFELIGTQKVGDDSWAHLAIRQNQIFVRNLNELVAFEWSDDSTQK